MPATPLNTSSRLERVLRPHNAFVLIAFFFGQALVILIPPFQSADEPYHFFRAYQITEGTFISRQMDVRGFGGGYLPVSLYNVWLPFSHMGFHLQNKAPVDQIMPALRVPLESGKRVFITLPSAAHYSPVCYLPQCVGIIIGRVSGVGPLAMLYLARECNLIARIWLGFLTLRWAPAVSRPLMLVLLMPMSLYVGSSASADVPTDAFAIAFSALVLGYCDTKGEPVDLGRLLLVWLLSLAVCLCKFAYAPLLGLLLLIPARRFGGLKRYWMKVAIILLIDAGVTYLWTSQSAGLAVRIRMTDDVSGTRQWDYLHQHPYQFVPILSETIATRTWMLFQTYVGVIGWYDMFLPAVFVVGYLSFLLVSCATSSERSALPPTWKAGLVVIPIVAISFLAIALLSYMYWTPVGASYIDGLHGRYLIPLTPAMLILVCSILPRMRISRDEVINRVVACFSICVSIYFLIVVWNRYYG
jgi:uncharacterized membrane protein